MAKLINFRLALGRYTRVEVMRKNVSLRADVIKYFQRQTKKTSVHLLYLMEIWVLILHV